MLLVVACIYPEYRHLDPNNPGLAENDAYPAAPDSKYGWEKLFSERLYLAYARNHCLVSVRKEVESDESDVIQVWRPGSGGAADVDMREPPQIQS